MSFMQDFHSEILVLTLSLYNNPAIPRKIVQLVVDILTNFTNQTLMNVVLNLCKSSQNCDVGSVQVVENAFKNILTVMSNFSSEHKRLEMYKNYGLLKMPEELTLDKFGKKSSAQHISLPWILKSLLEIPGSFDLLMNHMDEAMKEVNIVYNFVQSEFWRSIVRKYPDRKMIPLFFAHDDFNCGDPLGSNATKNILGDVCITLPGYPPHIASKLSNFFLTDLFYAEDRKKFGNRQVYSKLIQDLQTLEREGLIINLKDRVEHVYFCPCLEIGDNKGLNEDQGFVPTFVWGRCCRICRADVTQMKTMIVEILDLIRTQENYESDLRMRCPSETGLLEYCCFNDLDSYSATDNNSLDLMHDEFEGTANYLLTNVLHDLIIEQKIIELDDLNERIDLFNKSCPFISNKIPLIKKHYIAAKGHLKMSSAEMMNFVRFLGILVGYKIDRDEVNETWELYLTYRQILDYLLSPRIVEGHLQRLDDLIPEFLSMYIALYDELLYKFHSFVHIVRILRKFGSLIYYWAMRLESKQRELKAVATSSSNTQNLLKTISLRSQLKLAYFKATGNLQIPDLEFDSFEEIDAKTRLSYFPTVDSEISIPCCNNVVFKGIDFKVGMACVIEMGDNSLGFGLIEEIFIVQNEAILLFQPYTNICFDRHVYSYLVQSREAHVLKNIRDLPNIQPGTLTKIDEHTYFTPKYVL
ncbi:hypothetical protein QAD02_014253 [Eretmocerus hayati]|uniref:Uncharacterized protein n=1 Tax=Eretmocerus hayati TaxID=131215 RepID=A0ACC2P625_9HYME|nr:hypothetical protein QAD02_014253 [Eretmocerus hayati]